MLSTFINVKQRQDVSTTIFKEITKQEFQIKGGL